MDSLWIAYGQCLTINQPQRHQEIKVECKKGFSDAVGDEGKIGIRCTSTGYTGYIRNCVGQLQTYRGP